MTLWGGHTGGAQWTVASRGSSSEKSTSGYSLGASGFTEEGEARCIKPGLQGPPTPHRAHPPHIPPITSGFQIHEDWGPERLACLGTPDKQFIRHGQLFPRNGHPALPGGHWHGPRSFGMAVRRDVGMTGCGARAIMITPLPGFKSQLCHFRAV